MLCPDLNLCLNPNSSHILTAQMHTRVQASGKGHATYESFQQTRAHASLQRGWCPVLHFHPAVTCGHPAKLPPGAFPARPGVLQQAAVSRIPWSDAELHQEAEFGPHLGPAAPGAVSPPDSTA